MGLCRKPYGQWAVRGGDAAVAAACERFIADVLKPRFLPEIRVTEFNYPVDINGKWHGRNYRILQRYRSGGTHTLAGEFDSPFTRLEYVSRDRFDISYRRHNDQWWRLHRSVTLNEALRLIEDDSIPTGEWRFWVSNAIESAPGSPARKSIKRN